MCVSANASVNIQYGQMKRVEQVKEILKVSDVRPSFVIV